LGNIPIANRWHFDAGWRIFGRMTMHFDQTDYSVVVKNRARPPNPWRWEIYRAGRSSPIQQSPVYFETMVTASKAGKEALTRLLAKLHV
jgi:hypothetical protein